MHAESAARAESLRVRRLRPADLPKALALVRLVAPHLTLPAWRAMAERFGVSARDGAKERVGARSERCGILAVENAGGYIYALCSLRVVPDIVNERRLDAENIIVIGIGDESPVRRPLAAALDREARARGCRAISLRDVPIVRGLAGRGRAASYEACATTAYRVLAS